MTLRVPVAAHVLLVRGGSVLLLRRRNTGYEDGRLSLVAGHVEKDEPVTVAALREVHEEVGLALERVRLRVVGVMHRRSEEERIDFFLACELDGEEPRNAEPEKCAELVWAALEAPPADTIPYIRAALANFRAGRWFEEFGW